MNATALAGRLLLSLVFLVSGAMSLRSPHDTIGFIASAGLPLPWLGLAVQLMVELLGGLALAVGYRTRFIAAVLAAFSIAAALIFHRDLGDGEQLWQFLKNLAIAGGLLQLVASGPGRISLDARAETTR